ncbi:MAG TPA: TonB-dependent receptor [Bacteroidales bacterium]|nr:TonB-dependent receptor [Bacteroidales bacterium]
MFRSFLLASIIIVFSGLSLSGQADNNGVIEGRIVDFKSNEPVPFANVVLWGTQIGGVSDVDGNFRITGIKPGYVELRASSVGYKTYISAPILVTNAKKVNIEITLEETQVKIDEVTVQASPFRKKEESPVSLRRITIDEIERNPGSNRDIARVIQAFPGVAPTPSSRNDVIVRGGGAAENEFYLDGVEIPNLNHFATQGASGGSVSIVNIDFVREVNFYSGAFPANRGNALSSIIEFNQIDGNKEKLKFRGSVGASDLALTFDGPLTKNTTFVASARRSYLQFLFDALGLPFLPTYNDFQFKVRSRLDTHDELTFVGIGAIDKSTLNLKANKTEDQRYILGYLPNYEQWNYTVGVVYKHFRDNGFNTLVLSRNQLNNQYYKYRQNVEVDSMKILDYDSNEDETKLRYEYNLRTSAGYKINAGLNFEYARYSNNTARQLADGTNLIYDASLDVLKYGFFGQVSRDFLEDRATVSFGFRADGNDYNSAMRNPFGQFSPRLSLSYSLAPKWMVVANTGRYYQLPPYTLLGFENSEGVLINKQNKVKYISSDHFVAGVEYYPDPLSKLSVEGYYKFYRNYPVSVSDSVSISSKPADFGSFGDEEVLSAGEGRAFGMEVLFQTKNFKGFNFILSYTLVRSEAKGLVDKYIPTAWDNRHILNITGLRSLKRNWDVGFKWRFVGGTPYTPWDFEKSSLASAWDAQGRAYPDYSRFNELRLKPFHQLDIRVDKAYYFRRWTLRFYVDIQNVYNFKSDEQAPLVRETSSDGIPLPPSGTPQRYSLKTLSVDGSGTILPTIGAIIDL